MTLLDISGSGAVRAARRRRRPGSTPLRPDVSSDVAVASPSPITSLGSWRSGTVGELLRAEQGQPAARGKSRASTVGAPPLKKNPDSRSKDASSSSRWRVVSSGCEDAIFTPPLDEELPETAPAPEASGDQRQGLGDFLRVDELPDVEIASFAEQDREQSEPLPRIGPGDSAMLTSSFQRK